LVAQSGTVASGSIRTMAYAPASQRNLSCSRAGCWGFSPSSRARGIFLSSFMTLQGSMQRGAGQDARRIQGRERRAVSLNTSSGISVQPGITASEPSSFRAHITSMQQASVRGRNSPLTSSSKMIRLSSLALLGSLDAMVYADAVQSVAINRAFHELTRASLRTMVGSSGPNNGWDVEGSVRAKIESSEVMLGPFVSASSSRLDPCSTCSRCFPCGDAARDLRSGSGLTANRINLPNASELYPAFDFTSRSPRPALCYRPSLALSPFILQ
jgi:hypothetical protein